MGTRYRVTVERIDDAPENGEYSTRDTLLFEVTHQDPARLARFAPEEVLAALMEAAGVELNLPIVGMTPMTPAPENTVTVSIEPAGPEPHPSLQATADVHAAIAEGAKRKRRTKEEIAADKAAQELGYRDRFHRAEEEQKQAQHAGVAPEGGPVESVAAGGMPTGAELFGAAWTGPEANVFAAGGAGQPIVTEGAGGFDPFA